MEYLGSLGRLIGLSCNSSERVQAEDRYAHEYTLTGRRRAQVRPVSPRSWTVDWDTADPSEIAALSEFTTGGWGNGPWQWVPIQAQQGNLLTPGEAMLTERASVSVANVQDAGPVRDSTGAWTGRSVTVTLSSGWVVLARGVPVIAGKPFTFSCDVQGSSPQLHVAFMDAAGGTVSTEIKDGSGTSMQRLSLSATAPAGAVEAYVGVRSTVTRATRPQATWTAGPVPWSPGYGCRSAIVDGLTESLMAANRYGTYSDISFNVFEVS